ncbi:ROK family protein [Paraflavisolibacter sp. H34]
MSGSYAVGVDIGGTHITAAIVDLQAGAVVEGTLERSLVNAQGTTEEVLESWYHPMERVISRWPAPLRYLGVALPGPFDYEGGVALIRGMHKYDSIFGEDVKQFLARKLSLERDNIQMRNDTEAFLEGEVIAGAAKGACTAIAVTLGTGLGTARSLNGFAEDLNLGSSDFREGIAEDYLSTRWFVERYRELSGKEVSGVAELVKLGREDALLQQLFAEFAKNLALFLQGFIRFEKPDVVIIGGNISRAHDLFFPQLHRLLEAGPVKIYTPGLWEKAALIGAVSCWIKDCRAQAG